MLDAAAIGLGANLATPQGPPEQTLGAAIRAMADRGLKLAAISRYFRAPAFPAGSGPDYVNAVILLASPPEPGILLSSLNEIEAQLGRVRHERWGPRVIDLDLLFHGDQVLPDPATVARWRELSLARQLVQTPDRLILPHPRLQERAFVLRPLAELCPQWRHPATHADVSAMLAALSPSERNAPRPL